MDAKELKKILAGIGVVGLLAGGGVSVPGSAGASGWGGEKSGAVGTEKKHTPGSGWGGSKDDAGSVTEQADEAKSKAGEVVEDAKAKAGDVTDDAKAKAEEVVDEVKSEAVDGVEEVKKKMPQKSGWSGW